MHVLDESESVHFADVGISASHVINIVEGGVQTS